MKYSRYFAGLALAALGLAAIVPAASAVPVAGRETRTGDIYISGLTDYQSTVAEYSSLPRSRAVAANECGFLRLTGNSTSAPITAGDTLKLNGGSNVVFNTLPVEAVPKCTNGALAGNTSPSAALKDSDGNVYFTGLTPYSQNTITFNDVATTRSAKTNTCGHLRLSNSGNYVVTSGGILITDKDTGATIINIADVTTLPAVSGGPICRNGASFFATDWP
jgi:hypothetical protein